MNVFNLWNYRLFRVLFWIALIAYIVCGVLVAYGWNYLWNYAVKCRDAHEVADDYQYKVRIALFADPQMEGADRVRREGFYGYLNNIFNDWFEGWVVRSIDQAFHPEISLVLGDIFSRQDISDAEFYSRYERYKNIFAPLMDGHTHRKHEKLHPKLRDHHVLLNISGNHDLGYGNDINRYRIQRFERAFGPTNALYEDVLPKHDLLVMNSMVLDSIRPQEREVRDEVYFHLYNTVKKRKNRRSLLQQLRNKQGDDMRDHEEENDQQQIQHSPLIGRSARSRRKDNTERPLIIITHIPMYRKQGICKEYSYFIMSEDQYIKEQSTLSKTTSRLILDDVKPLFYFAGHNHDGCELVHPYENGHTIEYATFIIKQLEKNIQKLY